MFTGDVCVRQRWPRITAMCRLRPGYRQTRHNFAPVSDRSVYNVIRLNAYPDGGIARLNVFGHAYPSWDPQTVDQVRAGHAPVARYVSPSILTFRWTSQTPDDFQKMLLRCDAYILAIS